jgi:hypothetical protein
MNDTYIGIAGVVKDIDLEGHSWGTESGKGLGLHQSATHVQCSQLRASTTFQNWFISPFGTQPEIVVNRGCFAS